jgi:hypothetical protein
MTDLEIYNSSDVVKPLLKMWVIDGKLYRYYSRDRARNLVTLVNVHTNTKVNMLWTDFVKRRENIYTVRRVADLLNRHFTWLRKEIWYGTFKTPLYPTPDGLPQRFKHGYYTEKDVYEIRDIMVERRQKRKDGLDNQRAAIPSVQELTARMGRGMLMYTKLGDGRFVPIWEETI